MSAAGRRIWLCADDYGISPSVSAGIRELIERGRINATSVMVAAPHFNRGEATALERLNSGTRRVALGLHVTLTAPFMPMSEGFEPLRRGGFPPLARMARAAIARRLKPERLAIEIAAQAKAFAGIFGRPPDFIDGHQHMHLFPQVRDAVLRTAMEAAPNAWVRQCGRSRSARVLPIRKELLLDVLSVAFRRKARRLGLGTNSAFAGVYDFKGDFAALFPRFLLGLPDGGLVMCHPGFADAELKALDPVTDQRERELAYFNSDEFPRVLAEHGVALARPGEDGI